MFPSQARLTLKAIVVAVACLAFSVSARTSSAGEFQTASQEADRNCKTKAGERYRDQFTKAIDSAVAGALLGPCSKAGAVERAELVFIVSADGRITRVLSSPGMAYGTCIVSKLQLPKTVPRPPRDSWPVAIVVAWNEKRPGPPDTPKRMSGNQIDAYDKAIAPYVAKARATYPAAKKRFLEGLPPGYSFSVWTRLFQKDSKTGQLRHEDVFVDAESIKDGVVHGRIANKMDLLTNYKRGQRISVPESEVKNWLILRPDGVEEGNYVGKFLDHYKPQ
jgi:uncharacterized protein YegJ (DUF2314 family)